MSVKHYITVSPSSTNLLNLGVTFKGQLIVIVDVRELFLRQLNSARTGHIVDTAFLKHLIKCVTFLVESCCLDLTTFIKEINTKQFPLSILVMPCLDVTLGCTACLECPFVRIRGECFNRVDISVCRACSHSICPSWQFLLLLLWRLAIIAIEVVAWDAVRLWFRLGLFFFFCSATFKWLRLTKLFAFTILFENFAIKNDENPILISLVSYSHKRTDAPLALDFLLLILLQANKAASLQLILVDQMIELSRQHGLNVVSNITPNKSESFHPIRA